MLVHFKKLIHFTRLIKAGGRLREFNFRKLNNKGEELFSVDTVDDRGNRIIFYMNKQDSNNWVINAQLLPAWITDNEETLSKQIQDELSTN